MGKRWREVAMVTVGLLAVGSAHAQGAPISDEPPPAAPVLIPQPPVPTWTLPVWTLPPPSAAPPPPPQLVERSESRRIVGITLVSMGIHRFLAGLPVLILVNPIIGGPLMGSGAILGSIGAGLWATGAKRVPLESGALSLPGLPHVSVGAGSGSLTWSF